MSTKPGMIVLPDALITASTPDVLHAPTHEMRLPFTTTVPRSITCRLFSVTMRALVSATLPVGTSRGTLSLRVIVSVRPVSMCRT